LKGEIPKSSRTRLLRLISARADLDYASEALALLREASSEAARYHLFVSMVMAYYRPFTESKGIGSLRCEYPDFPDFDDEEMNMRHTRMHDIRNQFLGHSSIQGTHAVLLAPGSCDPSNGEVVASFHYAVAKRTFLRAPFMEWLATVIYALATRVAADLRAACAEIGSAYLSTGEIVELDTGHEDFTWTIPQKKKQ
jgi:hypothetical protein